jgi:hypothetical protein
VSTDHLACGCSVGSITGRLHSPCPRHAAIENAVGNRPDQIPWTPAELEAADPWDSLLAVDPFTGEPDHIHGDSCVEPECCE